MKQALLIMALQRGLGVALDGMRAGLAETTDELADLVFATLEMCIRDSSAPITMGLKAYRGKTPDGAKDQICLLYTSRCV